MTSEIQGQDPESGFEGKFGGLTRKLVAVGLVLLAIAGGWAFITAYILIEPQEVVEPVPVVDRYPEDPEEAVELARQAWERFVEAPTFSSRVAEVRDPDRVQSMMRDFHVERGHPFPGMSRISEGEPVNLGERRMIFFQVEGFDGVRYPVAIEWDGERFAVDWESLSAYGTMDWAEIVETRPTEIQTMRVFLGKLPDSLVPPVDNSGRWAFFRMEHRDSPEVLAVAADQNVGGEIAAAVEGKRVPVTAEVRWNTEIGNFEIVRVVAWTWSW